MKLKIRLLIIVLFFSKNIIFGISSTEWTDPESYIYLSSDSIPGKITSAVLKINPIQILLNEIPVSIEIFSRQETSAQIQVGFIFPTRFNSGIFESNGMNGDASSKGLGSYRNSPFNNHGISFKFEFRKYKKNFYHGPQFMVKHCYYKNAVFPVYGAGITLNQTEDKSSTIIGFGYVIGRQSNDRNIIFDWYAAFGIRFRAMTVKILEVENPAYRKGTTYPNTTDDFSSVYPFLNLGVRIGFRFTKTIMI
jgi:hypothetical protein